MRMNLEKYVMMPVNAKNILKIAQNGKFVAYAFISVHTGEIRRNKKKGDV
jgi:hypothetical protein